MKVKSGKGGGRATGAGVEGGSESQISEAIFPDLLNEQHMKYDEFQSGANVLVPEKVTDRPKRRLKAIE